MANILVTICARKGSKGVPSKNIRPLLGKPLIAHSIEQAKQWGKAAQIVVSTDSEEFASIAKQYGAKTPFLRPESMATDSAGKLPVIVHALQESEKIFNTTFDIVVDLDPTSPMRTLKDLNLGLSKFLESKSDVCFSVTPARKNPYFNMVEKTVDGQVSLVKSMSQSVKARQAAPKVWDMNASIYIFNRKFLLSQPNALWDGKLEIFEMPRHSAYDIDEEVDFLIVENLMRHYQAEAT